ncbi:MAG: WalW protein [Kordiimonas sp.]|nr:WalW protein [Kordiimonas sp.]
MSLLFPSATHCEISDKYTGPYLTVVIDTEEEFPWHERFNRSNRSVDCIQQQYLAQDIFREYGIVPTYVIDHPVVDDDRAVEVLKEWADKGECLIGTHLHPWVNPPYDEEVNEYNSYPGNLPPALEAEKLRILTGYIEERFGHRPVVYKAGRYGVGANTEKTLQDLGYQVDCSVVPYTNLSREQGPDFRGLAGEPFWINKEQGLFEVPLTRDFPGLLSGVLPDLGPRIYDQIASGLFLKCRVPGILARLGLMERIPLTPEGVSVEEHKRLTEYLVKRHHRFFSYTYHSSTLLVGGSPYAQNEAERNSFVERIDRFLDFFVNVCGGQSATPLQIRDMALEKL